MTDSELTLLLSSESALSDSDFRLLLRKDPPVSIGSSLYQHYVPSVVLSRELSVMSNEASPLRG